MIMLPKPNTVSKTAMIRMIATSAPVYSATPEHTPPSIEA
jgi:hypothetical protein